MPSLTQQLHDAAKNKEHVKLRGLVQIIFERNELHNKHKQQYPTIQFEEITIDAPDENKDTALSWAAFKNNDVGVDILLQARANLNNENKIGRTPLMLACIQGHDQIVNRLIEAEVNVNYRHNTGSTALMWAAHYGHTSTVGILLKAQAKVNYPDGKGNTALSFAAMKGYSSIVDILLKAGADPNIINTDQNNILDETIRTQQLPVIPLLLEKKSEIRNLDTLFYFLQRSCDQADPNVLAALQLIPECPIVRNAVLLAEVTTYRDQLIAVTKAQQAKLKDIFLENIPLSADPIGIIFDYDLSLKKENGKKISSADIEKRYQELQESKAPKPVPVPVQESQAPPVPASEPGVSVSCMTIFALITLGGLITTCITKNPYQLSDKVFYSMLALEIILIAIFLGLACLTNEVENDEAKPAQTLIPQNQ